VSAWAEVSTNAPVTPGTRYRWTGWLRMPYALAPQVRNVIGGAFNVARVFGVFKLESVTTFAPMASSGGVVSDRWRVEVVFRKV